MVDYRKFNTSSAERIFYLASKFDGNFTHREAKALLESQIELTESYVLSYLINRKLVRVAAKKKGNKPTQFAITDKGFMIATQFERMLDRCNKFIEEMQ